MRSYRYGDIIGLFDPQFVALIGYIFPENDIIHLSMKPLIVDNPCNVARDVNYQLQNFVSYLINAARHHIDFETLSTACDTNDFSEVRIEVQTIQIYDYILQFYLQWSSGILLYRRAQEGDHRCSQKGCILSTTPGLIHSDECYNGQPIPYPVFEEEQSI